MDVVKLKSIEFYILINVVIEFPKNLPAIYVLIN